ncbi:MAG: alanine--tRNA ligase [Candidatus Uhrbacteria bacterium]
MTSNELRQAYLNFFKEKGHAIIPSASLIPENDPTTLFTSSGMQPMVPYLLGEIHPNGTRITDSQKSFRTQDVEEVGDNRHTTFFEMLGNWSLGDYFKAEQIPWMFEFLTKTVGLNPEKLFVTCFRGKEEIGIPKDEEAAELWQQQFKTVGLEAKIVDFPERDGLQNGRIFFYDEKKNWWSRAGITEKMPVGEPGGPDSEMFWDFGSELNLHENSEWKNEPCHVNCDCGRFMEIGNNVFMAYKKTESGFESLKNKNVDFGGGFERIAAALNGDPDMFKIDLFAGPLKLLEELSGKKYGDKGDNEYINDGKQCWVDVRKQFRVILDHLRAATFLIGDGALPSNKDQGYFTRRLIRRSVRFARDLNIQENFCAKVGEIYIDEYQEAYPDLKNKKAEVLAELEKEEKRFRETLEDGIKEFDKLLKGFEVAFQKTGQKVTEISGKQAFKLYDTYGFPLEMTEEMAKENSLTIDSEGFKQAFVAHKDLSRAGAEQKFAGGLADHSVETTKLHTATHLLQAALRKILGPHVFQKGSNITVERLRFDFSHPEKVTPEQLKAAEDMVNEAINKNLSVNCQMMDLVEAKAAAAIGVFDDKYEKLGGQVKVYTIGLEQAGENSVSREVCGGPHVEKTGDLGHFKIIKEEAVSAGVRRIKAVLA